MDDIITYIKRGSIINVINILTKFHQNVKFTYEIRHNVKISHLDVLVMRCNGKLKTNVFRKETNNDISLHWRSFALITRKKSSFRILISRCYTVCCNDIILREELLYIKTSFTVFMSYPKLLLKQTPDSFENNNKNRNKNINNKNHNDTIFKKLDFKNSIYR